MANSLIAHIQNDLLVAASQGECKFIGQLYGDINFKIRLAQSNDPVSLELTDFKHRLEDNFQQFLCIVQDYNDYQLKQKQDEKQKS